MPVPAHTDSAASAIRRAGPSAARPSFGLPNPEMLVLGCFAAAICVTAIVSWSGSYGLKIGINAALLMYLIAAEWRRAGHPVTPVGIIGLGGLLIFVLRPYMLPQLGVTSPGAEINNRAFTGEAVQAASVAATQVGVFLVALGFVYFARPRRAGAAQRERVQAAELAVRRAGSVLVIALLIAGVCALRLVQSSGGLEAHLSGVANRSSFLAGRYFLTLGYVPLAVGLVYYQLLRQRSGRQATWSPLVLAATASLLASAFLTGGRGPLILGAVLPLVLVKQFGPKPLRAPALAAIGLALIGGAMVMSILLRDNVYTGGVAAVGLRDNPVETLIDRLTSGTETKPFDSLVLLNEIDRRGELPLQWGRTYAKAPTWFIPGSILPTKDGGANAWFTRNYLPSFFYPSHVETSISAVGEGFANFGWIGVVLAGAVTGLAASAFARLREGGSVRRTTFAVMLTPVFFSFVRGDSYQNLSLAALIIGLVLAIDHLIQRGLGPKHV